MIMKKVINSTVLPCYSPSCLLAVSFEVFKLFTPFTLSPEGNFEGSLEVAGNILYFGLRFHAAAGSPYDLASHFPKPSNLQASSRSVT